MNTLLSNSNNKDVVLRDLQAQVERLVTLLPEATEYCQAQRDAPGLVQHEKDPLIRHMLHTEDYHTLRTAHRWALYWKMRKAIFQDRWLRPMTQSGAGTLTPAQVEKLRSGYKVFTNLGNGAVCITDMSRLPNNNDNAQQQADPAIIFYLNLILFSL